MAPQADPTDQKAITQPDSTTSHLQSVKSHYIAIDDVLSAIESKEDIVTGMSSSFLKSFLFYQIPFQEDSNKARPRRRLPHKQNIRL